MTRVTQKGFTLFEMLVALTVFAVVSAMVYGGQVAVLKAKEGTERQALFLKQLQGAMMMLERDLGQQVLRPVRDEFGDSQLPLITADFGEYQIILTRAGWQNPLNLPRSTLQRVAYGIEDEKLVRYSWRTLDRAQGSEPDKLALLAPVHALKLRYLNRKREWSESWPPIDNENNPDLMMPLAIEFTLEIDGWGNFRRVIPTSGGGVDMQQAAKPVGMP